MSLPLQRIFLRSAKQRAIMLLRGVAARCGSDEEIEAYAKDVATCSRELFRFDEAVRLGILPVPEE